MRNIKNLHSQHAYLKKFIGPVQVKAMPPNPEQKEGLVVFGETAEAANHIIDQQVGDVLSKIGAKNIQEIHITD